MLLALPWRACPECRKSFDAIYRAGLVRVFGCRTCGRTEHIGENYADLTGDGGLPRATGMRTPARSPARFINRQRRVA